MAAAKRRKPTPGLVPSATIGASISVMAGALTEPWRTLVSATGAALAVVGVRMWGVISEWIDDRIERMRISIAVRRLERYIAQERAAIAHLPDGSRAREQSLRNLERAEESLAAKRYEYIADL